MNIEFTRPIKLVTAVAKSTHPSYYIEEPYGILYRDEDTKVSYNKTRDINTTLPTDIEGGTHIVEFTLPNLEVSGPGSIEIYCGGDIQNTVNINIVPSTGETAPIQINL